MHELKQLIAERISAGLKRKSLTTCSRWASACRIMAKPFPGPWSFKYHPWLKGMHDSKAEMNIGQKSAQMGYTETALNVTFFKIDVEGVDCLYVLPAKNPDASDFSAARFDPALELSTHLGRLFSDVKNVGHKRAGTTNLYVRGSRSRAGLKSVPVGFIVLDEVDEMTQENISLALERASGQMEKQIWAISTPTIDLFGINKLYQSSTQEHFFFKCPSCSKLTELIFPDCLVITADDEYDQKVNDSYLRCKECEVKLDHLNKHQWLKDGIWVPSYTNRDNRGFYVNQLYSSTVKPVDLAKSYLKSLKDPADEQEFYNSKLGIPHVVDGARVTNVHIDQCIGEYEKKNESRGLVTMGIDVGKYLHWEIDEWTLGNFYSNVSMKAKCKLLNQGKCLHFEELDEIFNQYNVRVAVIDANPERRKAYEFACRFWGHVYLCFYGRGVNGKQITLGKEEEKTITVDRTSWLDLSLSRFRNKTIRLPFNLDREYREQIKIPVRIYDKDADGNPIGKYVKGMGEDHYAHARNYAEIALPLAVSVGSSYDLGSIL